MRSCIYILPHLITYSCLSCYFCWSNNFWDGKQHLFRLASLAKQSNVVFVRRNSNNIKELVVERFLKKAIIAKPLILPFAHFMNMTNNINHFNLNLFCKIAKKKHIHITTYLRTFYDFLINHFKLTGNKEKIAND